MGGFPSAVTGPPSGSQATKLWKWKVNRMDPVEINRAGYKNSDWEGAYPRDDCEIRAMGGEYERDRLVSGHRFTTGHDLAKANTHNMSLRAAAVAILNNSSCQGQLETPYNVIVTTS